MKNVIYSLFGIMLIDTVGICGAMSQQIYADKRPKEEVLEQIQDLFPRSSPNYERIQNWKQLLQLGVWEREDEQEFMTFLNREDVQHRLDEIDEASARMTKAHQKRSQISPKGKETKGRILEQIQNVFPSSSYTYKQIKGLKQQLQQGKWTKDDEQAFTELLAREDVQHHLGEIDKASAKTTEGCQKRTSTRITPEEEERLTRKLLERDGTLPRYQQEKKDAEMARLLQNEEKERRNVHKIENRLPAPSGTLAMDLRDVVEAFFKIVGQKNDFDVHQFDPIFGEGNNIASKNCKTVISYLNDIIPSENVMTIQEIQAQMEQDLKNSPSEFIKENDLSIPYLNQAFNVLSGRHRSLIDLFRRVYTMITRYAPEYWRKDMLVSFVSNVNTFKGRYCYQGFRNRILSMFCLVYGHLHLGKR